MAHLIGSWETADLRQTYAARDGKCHRVAAAAANRLLRRIAFLIEIKVAPAVNPHARRMNELIMFALGSVALLAVPGPTNTLLASSGAARGLRPSLPLLFGEAAGYLIGILILRTIAAPLMDTEARLAQILSALVCAYLLFLSWKLWQSSASPLKPGATIGIGSVFLTTLLNPKAVVFAYLLLPSGGIADLAPWLSVLVVLIALCGSAWITVGAVVVGRAGPSPEIGYRAGAIALFVLAMVLGTRASGIG